MKTILLTFRKLRKNKTVTSLGLAGLIVGLVCVIYIFFWVTDEASYDRFHENTDRIFVVHAYLEGGEKKIDFGGCPPAVAPTLVNEYPEVESACRYMPGTYFEHLVTFGDQKNMLKTSYADATLFDIFTLPFVYGSKGTPDDPNQIVLTQTTASRYFGKTNPVGKIVRFNNTTDLAVAGVIEDLPHNTFLEFDAVVPVQNIAKLWGRDNALETWYNNAFATFGLLKSADGYDKIAAGITKRIQKEMPESTNYLRAYRFKDRHLYEEKNIRNVKIFSLIGLLVLLAATLNFINLTTARSTKQAKETGLRKSIGATRASIVRLIYSDVAIVCFMAFAAALLLAFIGLPFFNNLIGKQIPFASLFSPIPFSIFIFIYLLTVLLAGSYPAFFLSSFSVSETLKSSFHSVKNKGLMRNALIVTIFTVSIALLTSTLIISKQTLFLQKMDIGFNKEQLVYIALDGQLRNQAKTLKEEIKRLPNVQSATIAMALPVAVGNNGEGWNWEGKDPNFRPLVTNYEADENMLKTFEAKLIEGHFFSNDRRGIVINKAFADAIGWSSFEGKRLNSYGQDHQVVGVIDNMQYNSLAEACRPMAISNISDWSTRYLIVRTNTAQYEKTIQSMTQICERIEPSFPIQYGFVNDEFAKLIESESNLKRLVGIFSVFTLIVLCLGLLGVIMFLTEQKTKEIGVRKCLGERVSSIILNLLKPFVISGLIASALAIPATWFLMNRWLQSYTNRIDLNVWIFILSVAISIAIAVVTVSWQSWRAATRNPVEALRYE
jgi:putative ABC transport system permease protein